MDPLQEAVFHISPLSEESARDFLGAWQQWEVPKAHLLLRQQQVADYIYFIQQGIARIYYYKNEKEITEWIARDGEFFLSITSFFERSPSHLAIETLEPAIVSGIHYNDLTRLAAQHHEVETLFRKMVSLSLILSQRRMDSIQFETAHQRYEKLLLQSPDMVQRVPLSYIASFLGITLETLSRIRSGKK